MFTSPPIACGARLLDPPAQDTPYALNRLRRLAAWASVAGALVWTTSAFAAGYDVTDLVANKKPLVDGNGIVHNAVNVDPNLQNAWGVGESTGSPFWVSDNHAGVATLYNTAGTPQTRVVSIPAPDDPLGTGGAPTGLVFNPSQAAGAFQISGVTSANLPITAPAVFLFDTEDGTILGWNPNVNPPGFDPTKAGNYAIIVIDNSASGAIYKGLAISSAGAAGKPTLYATNFHAGTVEAYDGTTPPPWSPATLADNAFTDPKLQRGYAPFNVVPVGGKLFVTYAIQDEDAADDVSGMGHGVVDTYDFDGNILSRFAQHGQLDSPWGVVQAPASFGALAGSILIGNFGNGQINGFDPATGELIDKLRNAHGQAVVIEGLWTVMFGNGGNGGRQDTLYFTAGPNDETDGLFGSIAPSP